MARTLPQLIICNTDYYTLTALIDTLPSVIKDRLEQLVAELDRANVWPDEIMPPSVVTMNSIVEFQDRNTGKIRSVQLTYPSDANIDENRISVLAPTGAALLGLSTGQEISWPLPDGKTGRFLIKNVTQPAGNLEKLANG